MRHEQMSIGELTVDTIRGGGLDMFTKKFYVDPVNGSDGNPGTSLTNAKKTLAEGYKLLTANKNEALLLLPGASYHGLTASFVWNKAYTHLIGLAGPGIYGGRCRIYDTAAFAGILFSILSVGGIFKAIHWQRDFDSAIGVQNVTLGAGASYNYFEDCQLDAPIMASLGAAAFRNLSGAGANGSNTFRRCTIGQWNQQCSSTNGHQIHLAGENTSWSFMDCVIMWNTTAATFKPIHVVDSTSEYVFTLFDNCKFLGLGTSVTGLCASGTPAHGKLIFMNCTTVGVDEYDAGTNTRIYVANGSAIAGELGGKAVAIA
jgi:hypothetical protein